MHASSGAIRSSPTYFESWSASDDKMTRCCSSSCHLVTSGTPNSLVSNRLHRRHRRAPIDQGVLRVELGYKRVGHLAGAAGALLLFAPAKSLGVVIRADHTRRHCGLVDGLLKALQVLNIDYDMVDLCQATAHNLNKYKQVWAFSTDEMNANDQQTLVDYARAGGQLMIYPYLPDREMSQQACTIVRDALAVKLAGTETIDSPLIDIFDLKDIKCANPQIVYDEQSLVGAEIIARTIRGSACGFTKSLGRGSIIHLGTWIGFDTEGHKAVYEALLKKSGAKLRQAFASNDNIAVRQRFTPDNAAILFIGNYYNEEQEAEVTYTHPESGEPIALPYGQKGIIWPALYGVLTPVCLDVTDGIKILHSTSDILGVSANTSDLAITLQGDRDLAGEIVFEGARVDRIQSASVSGVSAKMVRDQKRTAFVYSHKHKEELTLCIQLLP